MVVVRLPNGVTHFVVVWRCLGPFVQIMDPAIGRRWITKKTLLDELYLHTFAVPAEAWREWAGTDEFLKPLGQRMKGLGLKQTAISQLIDAASSDPGWQALATLDAATRMVEAIVRSGGLRRGGQAAGVLAAFFEESHAAPWSEDAAIPALYWSVRPAPADEEGTDQLFFRGAIMVRVQGRRQPEQRPASEEAAPDLLSPELLAALEENPNHSIRELFRMLKADGLVSPALLLSAMVLGAGAVIVEALLIRGLIDIGQLLVLPSQRLAAIGLLPHLSDGPAAARAAADRWLLTLGPAAGSAVTDGLPGQNSAAGRSLFSKPAYIRYDRAQPQHVSAAPPA